MYREGKLNEDVVSNISLWFSFGLYYITFLGSNKYLYIFYITIFPNNKDYNAMSHAVMIAVDMNFGYMYNLK